MTTNVISGISEKVFSFKAVDPPLTEITPPQDRAFSADPEKKSLLSAARHVKHLTPYIGTEIVGVQLSQLTPQQKDDLALLVAEVSLISFP
jgi:sulfonate dioxygenase